MRNAQRAPVICALLAAITIAVFAPATHFGFLNCDDQTYVVNNNTIHDGITGSAVAWALKTNYASNWHPMTWISHMLDCDLFGSKPAGHHLTNVLLHAANSALVFLLLLQLTSAVWRSAFVGALFAWHPMHVESVAWVAERKDVLSTFFILLTIWAYARYVIESKSQARPLRTADTSDPAPSRTKGGAQPKVGAQRQNATLFYFLALFLFALALMSKPMAVTLPCVLLLLDFWPLGRIPTLRIQTADSKIWGRLLLEKVPFLVLAAADCAATLWAQKSANSVVSFQDLPFSLRLANAIVGYARYLGKLVWPTHLAVFYPYPDAWNAGVVAGAALLIVAISVAAFASARKYPFVLVGWLWFMGTLVPVIGLAQVGIQAMADRYAYVPSIGIFVILAWGLVALTQTWPQLGKPAVLLVITGLAALTLCTRIQLPYWRDSATLFRHALAVTPENIFAEYNLGQGLDTQGRKEEAAVHYARALELRPRRIETAQNSQYAAHYNWGIILANQQNRLDDAEVHFREVLRAKPDFWGAHDCLGKVLMAEGHPNEAIEEFRAVVRLTPTRREAWQQLGAGLERQGKSQEAAKAYEAANRLNSGILAQ